jgi:hypothetical protein
MCGIGKCKGVIPEIISQSMSVFNASRFSAIANITGDATKRGSKQTGTHLSTSILDRPVNKMRNAEVRGR